MHKKKIHIVLGIVTIFIIIVFWHKNYIEKTIPENTPAEPTVNKPVTEIPKPSITLCGKEQRGTDFCAQVYAPVCAEVQIQCIKAPCNPIKETFSSSCEACKNQLVSSYTAGECK